MNLTRKQIIELADRAGLEARTDRAGVSYTVVDEFDCTDAVLRFAALLAARMQPAEQRDLGGDFMEQWCFKPTADVLGALRSPFNACMHRQGCIGTILRLSAEAHHASDTVAAADEEIRQLKEERDCDEQRVADLMADLDRVAKHKDALRAVLADIAARQRYDPNRHENLRANRLPRSVTVNLPAELVERMEAVLAQTEIEP